MRYSTHVGFNFRNQHLHTQLTPSPLPSPTPFLSIPSYIVFSISLSLLYTLPYYPWTPINLSLFLSYDLLCWSTKSPIPPSPNFSPTGVLLPTSSSLPTLSNFSTEPFFSSPFSPTHLSLPCRPTILITFLPLYFPLFLLFPFLPRSHPLFLDLSSGNVGFRNSRTRPPSIPSPCHAPSDPVFYNTSGLGADSTNSQASHVSGFSHFLT